MLHVFLRISNFRGATIRPIVPRQTLYCRLFDFFVFFFFGLFFFTFSFLFAAVIDLLLGLLVVKKESVIETSNFYHGVATCSGRKFGSEFLTQLFAHFCAYLRLH